MKAGGGAPTKGRPTRIGSARPSHLVTTGGVGSLIDLPGMSVVVHGLDTWGLERTEPIDEPRLLRTVQASLGQQVQSLRTPPWDPQDADDAWTRTGVPVTPFPRWLRCPRCHRLAPLDPPGQFELVHRSGRRPDLAKLVHTTCPHQQSTAARNRRACLPARFLVACPEGHLDEFPYVDFVHHGQERPCAGALLTMRDGSSNLSPRVTIACTQCDQRRNVSEAAGRMGWEKLPACRGRHPHLQRFEPCGRPLQLVVLGASNLWFSVTASALHLPRSQSVDELVAAQWPLLSMAPDAASAGLLVGSVPDLRALRDVPPAELWAGIERVRGNGGPVAAADEGDLLHAEWQLLAHPTTQRHDDDFEARPTRTPAGFDQHLQQVVLVSRLREVQALVGFARLAAPDRHDLEPSNRLPLSRGATTWVPAFEQRGEGIFLELREESVAAFEHRMAGHPRVVALTEAYWRWSHNRGRPADAEFPVSRYLLLHTLSHMLVREVALECGYSSSSVRERLYVGTPGDRAAGILLSTAASDSEGTLGGLVALGRPEFLKRLLDQALDAARGCSSDPLCAEHLPEDPSDTLHAAACHACLFASETTCEANNRWLDRGVVVDVTGEGLAYFR